MRKVGFLARWGMVFSVLGMFSIYSIVALGVGNSSKAYADTISNNIEISGDNAFVVVDVANNLNNGNDSNNDNSDNSTGGGPGGMHHQMRKICAINQNQLDSLRANYDTSVVTKHIDGQDKNFAQVKGDDVTKKDIYNTIGVNTDGPKCKIIKEAPKSFLLLMLPGVS